MGTAASEFWDMSVREVMIAIDGYQRREERISQERWNIFRHTVSMLLSPHMKKGQQIRPTDIMRFKDEIRAAKANELSPEELMEKLAIIDRKKEFKPLSSAKLKNEFRRAKSTNRG